MRPAALRSVNTHLVLKEVEVEVALEASHKGDAAGLPLHRVGEGQGCPRRQRLRALAGKVDVDDLQAGRRASRQAEGRVRMWWWEGSKTRWSGWCG